MIIKRKKLTEKTTTTSTANNNVMTPGSETPPGLSHSLPTSATFSDSLDRTRSASIDSNLSLFDFNAPQIADYTAYNAQMHSSHSQYANMYPEFSPYEIDVKTERHMFVNDSLTRRESTISTFSTYHPPPPPEAMLPSYPAEDWEAMYDSRRESLAEEPLSTNLFDFSHGPPSSIRQVAIELDEGDQRLLDHFVSDVLPTVFPILETNQHDPHELTTSFPRFRATSATCTAVSASPLSTSKRPTTFKTNQLTTTSCATATQPSPSSVKPSTATPTTPRSSKRPLA